MVNRFPGSCVKCGSRVAAKAGMCEKQGGRYVVMHLACRDSKSSAPQVYEVRLSSGHSFTRNVRGICEDAPCCGCCTF